MQSSVKNLKLSNLYLAKNVISSHIEFCITNCKLITGNATNCTITACQSCSSLINGDANNCTITACKSSEYCSFIKSDHLINGNANNCTIIACQAGDSLINSDANNCAITTCQSNNVLILQTATSCTITDCLVASLNLNSFHHSNTGGVVKTLKNSTVDRCLVMGKIRWYDRYYFSGITDSCDASTIHQCAIGKLGLYKKSILGWSDCERDQKQLNIEK